MMKLIFSLLFSVSVLVLLVLPKPSTAQDYKLLFQQFQPGTLTRDDKRFLQAALAFQGHYKGLFDGDWGKLSQSAMQGYSARNFDTGVEPWHMAALAFSFFDEVEKSGWQMYHSELLGMSYLWPSTTLVSDKPTNNFINFRHSLSSLSYSVGVLDQHIAQNVHDFTQKRHAASGKPYTVRKTNFAISTSQLADGSYLYTRSNLVNGRWSTVMLSASRQDKPLLDAVSSSITTGYGRPITVTENGVLEAVILKTIDALDESKTQPNNATQPAAKPPKSGGSSGTGFVVSSKGHVLTNDHVIDGCTSFTIDGTPAKRIAASPEFDLALLQTTFEQPKPVAVFSATSPRLNSDVTVVGYPYGGALSGLNVTRGSVSSLKGLGGDATRLQITAPVQQGNSGGPLVGADGEVVGVIVSKLDVLKFADAIGDMPQNVNFAVRGEIAKLFLSQNGVSPALSLDDNTLAPTEIAERTAAFTVFIECN